MSREFQTAQPAGSRDPELARSATAKALAEIEAAEALVAGGVRSSGDAFAQTLLVKGEAGPAEESGGDALSGEDGVAADKALAALGLDPSRTYRALSRPVSGEFSEECGERLAGLVAAVDPAIIVALDVTAANDVQAALGTESLRPGVPISHAGIFVLAVEGLEASLGDDDRKRTVWSQMQALEGATHVRI